MEQTLKRLENSDILGVRPSLLFNKKKEFKTIFGGCVSLSFIAVSLCCFVFFFLKLVQGEATTLSFASNSITEFPAEIESKLEFAFKTEYPSKIKVYLGETKIESVPCESTGFEGLSDISTYFCIPLPSLEAIWGNSLSLETNVPTTIYYKNSEIFPRDYSNPVEERTHSVEISQTSFFLLEYKLIKVKTDSGWIFESYNSKTHVSQDQMQNNASKFNFEVRFSGREENFVRKYYKLQDFMAQLGGFIKFLYVVGKILVYPINEAFYYQALIQSEKKKHSPKQPKLNVTESNMDETTKNDNRVSKTMRQLQQFKQVSLFRVVLSNFWLFSFLDNQETKQYRKIRHNIETKLDISNFLTVLRVIAHKLPQPKGNNNFI